MKLAALRLHNVRRFAGRGVAIEGIGNGVNVLCAANEYGKSTCFDALHALFFQPYSGTPDAVRSLRPYSGGSPLIEVDVLTEDGNFRLSKQYYGRKRAAVTDPPVRPSSGPGGRGRTLHRRARPGRDDWPDRPPLGTPGQYRPGEETGQRRKASPGKRAVFRQGRG